MEKCSPEDAFQKGISRDDALSSRYWRKWLTAVFMLSMRLNSIHQQLWPCGLTTRETAGKTMTSPISMELGSMICGFTSMTE